jgi:hypothetical protein
MIMVTWPLSGSTNDTNVPPSGSSPLPLPTDRYRHPGSVNLWYGPREWAKKNSVKSAQLQEDDRGEQAAAAAAVTVSRQNGEDNWY